MALAPRKLSAMLLASTLVTAPLVAQTGGAISATATVVAALTVTGTGDLVFGTVASTATKTVTAAGGGTYQIRGEPGVPVGVSFTLPATLGDPALTLSGWTGRVNSNASAGSASAFSPSSTLQAASGGSGKLYIWIGATLTTTSAPNGSYSVPIIISVVYN